MIRAGHDAGRIGAAGARRWVAALLGLGVLAALLTGCGRKGDLEPALDPSVAASSAAGDTEAPIARRSKRVPITPPKESFILDPLL